MNSKMPIGSYVTVTANTVEGRKFLGWINPANGKILSTDVTYSFYTGGNDFISAFYQENYEGTNLVIFTNDKSGQYFDMQYYVAGDSIVFPDDPTQIGYDFAGWDHTEAQIQAKLEAGEDVTVKATWTVHVSYVDIIVHGGSVTSHGQVNEAGQYLAASAVTITADAASSDMKFAYWKDAEGQIRSYHSSYKFYPGTDMELTAVYVEADASIDYQVLVSVDACDTTGKYGTFYYSWYVPEEGYTYQAAGIVAVNKEQYKESTMYHGTSDANVWDRAVSGSYNTSDNAYSWTGPVYGGETWFAMAWVQYTDAEGNLIITYSDLFEITKY